MPALYQKLRDSVVSRFRKYWLSCSRPGLAGCERSQPVAPCRVHGPAEDSPAQPARCSERWAGAAEQSGEESGWGATLHETGSCLSTQRSPRIGSRSKSPRRDERCALRCESERVQPPCSTAHGKGEGETLQPGPWFWGIRKRSVKACFDGSPGTWCTFRPRQPPVAAGSRGEALHTFGSWCSPLLTCQLAASSSGFIFYGTRSRPLQQITSVFDR